MQPQNQFSQHPKVKGLYYINNFISPEQQKQLIKAIIKQPWNTSLKRRTQHYGYEYSYDRKSQATKTTQIPQWCWQIKKQLQNQINKQIVHKQNKQITDKNAKQLVIYNQMIVNQYQPGQGINPHVDNINLFQDYVVSISLGSDTIMVFQKAQNKVQVPLKRCSMVVLSADARYQWKHSIPSRKNDNGIPRGIRYSLTFRQMKNIS